MLNLHQTPASETIFNRSFYPTPLSVIEKMLACLEPNFIRKAQILEPSAGKGDILDYLTTDQFDGFRFRRRFNENEPEDLDAEMDRLYDLRQGARKENIYAIEVAPDLQAILRSKQYAVVGSDFLAWQDHLHIDLVVMNPPFADGAQHLLKAFEVVADGGQVVCLLNAETINNPFSVMREQLNKLISEYGTVEQLGPVFKDAERPTSVNVALVHLKKPARERQTFTGLDEETGEDKTPRFSDNMPVTANAMEALVTSYNLAVEALRHRYDAETAYNYYLGGIKDYENDPVFMGSRRKPLNEQIQHVKGLFWKNIFDRTKIGQRTTSDFRKDFEAFIAHQSKVAFTVENIMQVLAQFVENLDDIMQRCIVDTFDRATRYHEKNATKYLVDGWKTNKSWRLNEKIINPSGITWDPMFNRFDLERWRSDAADFYNDLDRCCAFLSGRKFEDIHGITKAIEGRKWLPGTGFKLDSEFFTITLYKKGTVHLVWKDKRLLAQFNQAAARGKNWVGDGS